MKKLVNEIIVILVLILAMYLISTSGIVFEEDKTKNGETNVNNNFTSNGNILETKIEEDTRIKKLRKAKESLMLYRLYKKDKLIEPVLVVLDDRSIDLNTANAYELTFLKGIGKSLSQRIVEYRIENGAFYSVEDIVKVKGIGKKKLEKIVNQ